MTETINGGAFTMGSDTVDSPTGVFVVLAAGVVLASPPSAAPRASEEIFGPTGKILDQVP